MAFAIPPGVMAQGFSIFDPGLAPCTKPAATWVDHDNDGDLDIFMSGLDLNGDPASFLYRNDGGGYFTQISTSIAGLAYASCAFGDMDNDGLADLALMGENGGPVTRIYRNDGGGAFTDTGAGLEGLSRGSLAWADYNNDGFADLLITGLDGSQEPQTLLYKNSGNGTFSLSAISLTGLSSGDAAWSDFDRDLDPDVVVLGRDASGTPRCIVYLNDEGSFTEMGAGLAGLEYATAAWGDFNNDGYPDLLTTGMDASGTARTFVYKNNGGTSFTALSGSFSGVAEGAAIWGDMDNDGDLDFVVSGSPALPTGNPPPVPEMPVLEIYLNQGGDLFNASAPALILMEQGRLACGDYDNDSDLDLLLCGELINPISGTIGHPVIFRNNTSSVNTPPSAPAGLTYEVSGTDVQVSWDATTDDHTPQQGLSYNLRIGTTEGNMDIFSALAGLSSGYRRIVAAGNASQNTSWVIDSLVFGQYYASVQALDHNYAGSAFSATLAIDVVPLATFSVVDSICIFDQATITYTGNASPAAPYDWDFDGASVLSGSGQGPYVVFWHQAGLKTVTLTVTENGMTSEPYSRVVAVLPDPGDPGSVTGPTILCQGTGTSDYQVAPIPDADVYEWRLLPEDAGTISNTGPLAGVAWDPEFYGSAEVFVRGINDCGYGNYSDTLDILVEPLPGKPGKPEGPSDLCQDPANTEYAATPAPFGLGHQWALLPESAGAIFSNGLVAEVNWDEEFTGVAKIFLWGFNDCGSGAASDTLMVVVNVPPTANAGENQVVNFGNSTQLLGSASGGSGDYSYYWMPDSLLTDPAVAEPITLALEQSVQFVLYVTDNLTSCTGADQVVVTVIGGPLGVVASAEPAAVCPGDEVQLLALAGGASGNYTYSWSSDPPGFSSDIPDPLAYPEVPTRYFVEAVDAEESAADSVDVGVFPLPGDAGPIAGPDKVCAGDDMVLYEIDPVPDAVDYLWTLSTGLYGSSDSTSIMVKYTMLAYDATITVTPMNGCGNGGTAILDVEVVHVPAMPPMPSGPDTLCTTTDTTAVYSLESPVPGATAYEWKLEPDGAGMIYGNGLSATVQWIPDWEGEARVSLRASNDCGPSAWSEAKIVSAYSCLGIGDAPGAGEAFRLFPNPAREMLYIDMMGAPGGGMLQLDVYDLFGRALLTESLPSGDGPLVLNVSSLSEGMYILTVRGHGSLPGKAKFVLMK